MCTEFERETKERGREAMRSKHQFHTCMQGVHAGATSKLNPLALVFTLACAAQPNSFHTSMRLKKRNVKCAQLILHLRSCALFLWFVKKAGFEAAPNILYWRE
jgi:hypothetical protein